MTDKAQKRNTKAVAHGLTSDRPVIPGMESEEQYEQHLAGITDNLAPDGRLEEELAERVASLLWRLRRVTRYETATTRHVLHGIRETVMDANRYIEAHPEEGRRLIDTSLIIYDQERHLVLEPYELDKIMRYEAHLHRQCLQTLHELEALQARRNGEQTHLARLDVTGSPGAHLAAVREKDPFS